jgi:hypothetical protein
MKVRAPHGLGLESLEKVDARRLNLPEQFRAIANVTNEYRSADEAKTQPCSISRHKSTERRIAVGELDGETELRGSCEEIMESLRARWLPLTPALPRDRRWIFGAC